jgi:hypothetical protein
VRGDRVEIAVDTGGGVQVYEIVATRAGRRVEVATVRGVVEVSEVTRSGQVVRTGRFMANRVIALVEHPAKQPDTGDGPARPRRVAPGQESLGLDRPGT